jgi:hypothetical protein
LPNKHQFQGNPQFWLINCLKVPSKKYQIYDGDYAPLPMLPILLWINSWILI